MTAEAEFQNSEIPGGEKSLSGTYTEPSALYIVPFFALISTLAKKEKFIQEYKGRK